MASFPFPPPPDFLKSSNPHPPSPYPKGAKFKGSQPNFQFQPPSKSKIPTTPPPSILPSLHHVSSPPPSPLPPNHALAIDLQSRASWPPLSPHSNSIPNPNPTPISYQQNRLNHPPTPSLSVPSSHSSPADPDLVEVLITFERKIRSRPPLKT